MKTIRICLNFFVVLIFFLFHTKGQAQDSSREYYVLQVYTLANAEQESLTDSYLQHGLLPALKRQQISSVGVFKWRTEVQDSILQRFVLYPVSTPNSLDILKERLDTDEELWKNNKSFLEAPHDAPPYQRIETIFLKAFKEMPIMQVSNVEGIREDRVYELRSYESPTQALFMNKVHMFNEGGEVALFDRLGFNAVFYAEVLAGPSMPNLMYMTTFKDMETRDLLWKAFVDSPEWQRLINDSYYNNNLSKLNILLLSPTAYSDY
ncbi:NIPSNAP family protein [uncultured Muriicola sp.]|uniref:NIPSNAP family protein n=1 Tax=uncultured Muriicola sp. TaxID=1583102 RepID=UPI00260DF43E|nr:NIPSNAP family protein [uncultured Muriicola sp.]